MTGDATVRVSLFEPATETASKALARYLADAGLRATVHLPDPGRGRLPYCWFTLSLGDGKQLSAASAESAVVTVVRRMQKRFGMVEIELNGSPVTATDRA